MNHRIKPHGVIGIAGFVLAVVMLRQGREPFTTYFYCFAWWSYILVADALVYRLKGESLLMNSPHRFITMIPMSISLWCIFELFNFRLENWHYINVPHDVWARWLGYAVAYGTVLPGLCETSHLVRATGLVKKAQGHVLRVSVRLQVVCVCLGLFFLLGTLVLPQYCFPLVWIGFALLIDPVRYRRGGYSLLRDIEKGELQTLFGLLVAGIICGVLWELWNYWAHAKWIYTVPFFEGGKIFEMPVLGYLGFPTFSVSAYLMYCWLRTIHERCGAWRRGIFWLLLGAVCLLVFVGIDRYTVISRVPRIRDMPGLKQRQINGLSGVGFERVQDLVRRGTEGLLALGLPLSEAEELVRRGELITLKGVGTQHYLLFSRLGIHTVFNLAQQNPSDLYEQMARLNDRERTVERLPSPAVIRLWVREARKRVACSTAR